MRTARVLGTVLVCALLLAGAWLGWAATTGAFSYRPLQLGEASGTGPWIGAVHVHTQLSGDATGTVEEIAAAAGRAGLDFVIIADHARALGDAGRVDTAWHDDVLIVSGAEISTDAGHLLAVGLKPHPFALGPAASQAMADIEELGGDAFVAHPDGGETAWTAGWMRARGVEIASLSSALKLASTRDLLAAAMLVPINADAATARLVGDAWGGLQPWDQRTAMTAPLARPIVGVGAADAHGPVAAGFPDHETAFRALATMVWMPADARRLDARSAAAGVLRQLAAGRTATVYTSVGSAPGLTFRASRGGVRSLDMGETGPWRVDTWTFRADLGGPGAYRLELLRDGQVVATALGEPLEARADAPGTYRLQASRTDVAGLGAPWLVTNPIYLWTDEAIAAARIVASPPVPPPPLAIDLLTEPGWAAASDVDSGSAMARAEPGLRWDLRVAEVEREGAYAALSWRPAAPLAWQSMAGLAIRLRAERSLRVSLRIWTIDESGSEQTWERVVRAGPEGLAEVAPFAAFRRIDVSGRGDYGIPAASLGAVSGVALVVTPQRLRPGSEASVTLEGLGAYGR